MPPTSDSGFRHRNSAGVRATAVRRAHEAAARRDAERIRRERELEAALVDYYAALARIEKIRAKAAHEVEPFEQSVVARRSQARRSMTWPNEIAPAEWKRSPQPMLATADGKRQCRWLNALRRGRRAPSPGQPP